MKSASILLGFSLVLTSGLVSCESRPATSQNTYESSYESSSTTDTTSGDSYMGETFDSIDGINPQVSLEEYANNSLITGDVPYPNVYLDDGNECQIRISTSSEAKCDLVAVIKQNNQIVRNAYILAGGTYEFSLPNGTFQVFFYGGNGWNPDKRMPNGLRGGFVANESYSKDSPISLEYEGIEYQLIPQPNGNFSTQQSDAQEIF